MTFFLNTIGWFAIVAFVFWSSVISDFRRKAVPGSYQRYYWNSMEKIFRWPAGLYCFTPWLGFFRDRQALSGESLAIIIVASAMMSCVFILSWITMRRDDRDDDDDWFKKTGRRLRRWVRKVTKVRVKVPVTSLVG